MVTLASRRGLFLSWAGIVLHTRRHIWLCCMEVSVAPAFSPVFYTQSVRVGHSAQWVTPLPVPSPKKHKCALSSPERCMHIPTLITAFICVRLEGTMVERRATQP
jgi:hypothetical protein